MNTDNRTLNETNIDEVIDKTIRKTNIVLDATVLSSLMACPRMTDFRFNLNLQSIKGKSNSLECGSTVHKFLEVYYKAIINQVNKQDAIGFGLTAAQLYIQGCPDCTDFLPTIECPKPKCGHPPNDYPGVFNTPQKSEGYIIGWEWVLETCTQYAEHYSNDFWIPLEIEVVHGKILYEDDEIRVMWKAKFDALFDTNQGIYPMDHKTMKQRRDSLSLNNQFMGQCLIAGTQRMFINKIGFQTTLKPVDKFTRTVMSYTSERLIEWQSETLPYYAKLLLMYAESNHFPPNYASCEGKYGNCPFSDVCSSNPDMREETLKTLFRVGPQWNPTNEIEAHD